MWSEYVENKEGVAIKSSIRKLASSIYVHPEFSHIGKVKYVNLDRLEMSTYEASQAPERAFLKDKMKYSHENEVRITTMSLRTPMCVNMNGQPITEEECSGKNMNNFDYPGLYIRVDLNNLMEGIVLSPDSEVWFELLVKRIADLAKFRARVKRSEIEKIQQFNAPDQKGRRF